MKSLKKKAEKKEFFPEFLIKFIKQATFPVFMLYKAVIFDLDGTLVHTAPDFRYIIVGESLRELGATAKKEDVDKFWFGSQRNRIIEECFGVPAEDFWKAYEKRDLPELRRAHIEIYDDFDFVRMLIKEGYRTGIVTGAPERIVNLYLENMDGINFYAIITANTINGIMEKPDPHGIAVCLEILGVEKQQAIYVGNGEEDIVAAKQAGVLDVLIERGEHGLIETEPSLMIGSLYELRDLLGF